MLNANRGDSWFLIYFLTSFSNAYKWLILGNIIKVKYAKEKEKPAIRNYRHSQSKWVR